MTCTSASGFTAKGPANGRTAALSSGRRAEIVDLLAQGERPVDEVAQAVTKLKLRGGRRSYLVQSC